MPAYFVTDACIHLDIILLKVSPTDMGLMHPSIFSADNNLKKNLNINIFQRFSAAEILSNIMINFSAANRFTVSVITLIKYSCFTGCYTMKSFTKMVRESLLGPAHLLQERNLT